jgi:hypothetical protein
VSNRQLWSQSDILLPAPVAEPRKFSRIAVLLGARDSLIAFMISSNCRGTTLRALLKLSKICHHMFVRFRENASRLQVSVVETRRVGGRVRNEHVAGFGSVVLPMTVPDRIRFWNRLHVLLARRSNRLDATMQGKILGEIDARIPMVTADEQRAKRLAAR